MSAARKTTEARTVSYSTLFLGLSATLILQPALPPTVYGTIGTLVLAFWLIGAAAWAASDTPKLRHATLGLFGLAVLSEVLVRSAASRAIQLFGGTVLSVYLVFVTTVVIRSVLQQDRAPSDSVMRGTCAYLLIGVAFYFIFCTIETASPGAFAAGGAALAPNISSGHEMGRYPDLLYFSFVTLTSLGYGDIVPVSSLAKSLVNTLAVIGQLYLAVLMAGLVGRYASRA